MHPSFKKPFWISSTIIIGGAILVWVALYILAGNISTSVGKIVAARLLINQQTNSLTVFSELKQQAAQAATYQTAMDDLVPTQDGLISFEQWFAGIATQQQVSANAAFQNDITPPTGSMPGHTEFTFTANGSLENLVSFINALKTSPGFFLNVASFKLVNNQGDVYQLNGQGNVFFRP